MTLLPKLKNVTVMFATLLFLCLLGIDGKSMPSFSLKFPDFSKIGRPANILVVPKNYTGYRVSQDSIRMVYVNDFTVAIVELGANKLLLNCELIEIWNPEQVMQVLGELTDTARPMMISFEEMVTLMKQCKQLEEMRIMRRHKEVGKNSAEVAIERSTASKSPFTLLNGIVPGTKWCGTGDIAKNYFDLGVDSTVDSCCRTHDLCPVKIMANSKKYDLENNSFFTKSHCKCDDWLYQCLKKALPSPSANLMGQIYFNIVQVPCLSDTDKGLQLRSARKNF
ncbi:uncharacterized protein LOC126884018 [Diabrotica virgifera virgifera]|uniref:Phospholipase A2 n=1 Tax=Diabrotica virgifera virgifera TaxID=50390 RepID=A0A6P7GT17_DIAVI|nr:uncharacterized protein LOC126884018 [Diabrotica virgifera virgifera]